MEESTYEQLMEWDKNELVEYILELEKQQLDIANIISR